MLAASEAESASSIEGINDSRRVSNTWSFRAYVLLNDGLTFSSLLDARKQQLDTSLASASVISWARLNTAQNQTDQTQDSNGEHFEGFVHASTHIRLGSLRRVLPEKQTTDAGKIVEVTFEEVNPGPGKDYMCHPTIKTFLDETSLDPRVLDKRKRVDYRGSSASFLEIILAKTWFGCGTMRCSDPLEVESIFRSDDVARRQTATLGSADVITFACAGPRGPESALAASCTVTTTVQVEVLVHSSSVIRRVTLESWLDPAQNPNIAKFEWEAVQTGKGTSYLRDPTVKKFLEESALDPSGAGKRQRIDLAGTSGHSHAQKVRPKAWV
jgi:hypothetical protein